MGFVLQQRRGDDIMGDGRVIVDANRQRAIGAVLVAIGDGEREGEGVGFLCAVEGRVAADDGSILDIGVGAVRTHRQHGNRIGEACGGAGQDDIPADNGLGPDDHDGCARHAVGVDWNDRHIRALEHQGAEAVGAGLEQAAGTARNGMGGGASFHIADIMRFVLEERRGDEMGGNRAVVLDADIEHGAGSAAAAVADGYAHAQGDEVFRGPIGVVDRLQQLNEHNAGAAAHGDVDHRLVADAADEVIGAHTGPDDGKPAGRERHIGQAEGEGQRIAIGVGRAEIDDEIGIIGGIETQRQAVGQAERQPFLGEPDVEIGQAQRGTVIGGIEFAEFGRGESELGRRQQVADVEGIADAAHGDLEIAARAAGTGAGGAGRGFDAIGFEQGGDGLRRDFDFADEDGQALHRAIGHHDDGTVRLHEFEIGAIDLRQVDAGIGRQAENAALLHLDHYPRIQGRDLRIGRRLAGTCRIGLSHQDGVCLRRAATELNTFFVSDTLDHDALAARNCG